MANFLSEPISIFGINPRRAIGEFTGFITFDETGTDKVTLTKHPVQQGATISDHAYKEPTLLTMTIQYRAGFFSDSLSDKYEEFLELQNTREPLTVYTGKRTYINMVLISVGNTTNKETENVLRLNLSFEEVILVEVTPTTVPARSRQRSPGVTGATEKAGKKSALVTLKEGIGSLIGGN